ncbi:MAG: glycosyltransferase, partial [Bacteroidales bacterium]
GIFDLYKYLTKIDYLFLNWIEDLPDKKAGWIQSLFFISIMPLLKAMKIKIIWTMHNKQSHYSSNRFLKAYLFRFVLRHSDSIITHSNEGVRYFSGFKIGKPEKIRYFPHPLEKKYAKIKKEKPVDILIWGSLIPYKGIDKFLKYLYDNGLENKYKIVLAGKVNPEEYLSTIQSYCNDNIRLDNRYIPEKELKALISGSKVILFTYEKDSVLSSGALMDSLSYGGFVIGPSTGAFRDLQEEGLIKTYSHYDEIIQILNDNKFAQVKKTDKLESFIRTNSWPEFSSKVSKWILN